MNTIPETSTCRRNKEAKPTFSNIFLVEEVGPEKHKTSLSGFPKVERTLKVKDFFFLHKEGAHKMLFNGEGCKQLNGIEPGDKVLITFHLHAGISLANQSHTNLVPVRLIKI